MTSLPVKHPPECESEPLTSLRVQTTNCAQMLHVCGRQRVAPILFVRRVQNAPVDIRLQNGALRTLPTGPLSSVFLLNSDRQSEMRSESTFGCVRAEPRGARPEQPSRITFLPALKSPAAVRSERSTSKSRDWNVASRGEADCTELDLVRMHTIGWSPSWSVRCGSSDRHGQPVQTGAPRGARSSISKYPVR
jgi:hypothetical protein